MLVMPGRRTSTMELLPAGLDPETQVLLSEVVTSAAEYRLFLLDGRKPTGRSLHRSTDSAHGGGP